VSPMAVVERDLATGQERTVYASAGPGGFGWGPNEVLAVLELDPATYTGRRLTLLAPDGSRREVDVGEPAVAGLAWHPHADQLLLAGAATYSTGCSILTPAAGGGCRRPGSR